MTLTPDQLASLGVTRLSTGIQATTIGGQRYALVPVGSTGGSTTRTTTTTTEEAGGGGAGVVLTAPQPAAVSRSSFTRTSSSASSARGASSLFTPVSSVSDADGADEDLPTMPFSFGYDETDEFGTNWNHRSESGEDGVVTGSYGYR